MGNQDILRKVRVKLDGYARTVTNGTLGLYIDDPEEPREVEVGHKCYG